jgi:ATP-dependent DNA helicase RecG
MNQYSIPKPAGLLRRKDAGNDSWSGPVDLDNLDPTPKNPVIARVFTQMGRSEELGSGTRNLYKFSRLYSGTDPVLVEGDCIEAFVPVPDASADADRPNAAGAASGGPPPRYGTRPTGCSSASAPSQARSSRTRSPPSAGAPSGAISPRWWKTAG